MFRNVTRNLLLSSTLLITACGGGGSSTNEDPVTVNATIEEVGKLIFFDTRLSRYENQSCASCHAPEKKFADPRVNKDAPVSEGSPQNAFGDRNAPTATYASFTPSFGLINDPVRGTVYAGGQFLDGRADSLEEQAKAPFTNPVEMANDSPQDVVSKIQSGPYADKFKAVFGDDIFNDPSLAFDKVAAAIAAFERTSEVNPFDSKFDCYLQGKYTLSAQEALGLLVFENKGKCANCHSASPDPVSGKVLFTNFQYFNIGVPSNPNNPAVKADPTFVDLGLGKRLNNTAFDGKFKTPTLRNVAATAPYMHNGVFQTLKEVVEFYNLPEKIVDGTPEIPDTVDSAEVDFLDLTQEEMDALVTFMETLTDGTGKGICF